VVTKYVAACPELAERDGDQCIAEYDANDVLLRKYVYGPGIDQPICMIEVADANAAYFYHFDALGSVVALSDADGETVQVYEYDVYGQVAASDPNHPNRFMFTGREFDAETGLYYYRARYYNPTIGRFLQTDPTGYADGLNLYQYCSNNPWNRTDALGTRSHYEETYGTYNDCCHPGYAALHPVECQGEVNEAEQLYWIFAYDQAEQYKQEQGCGDSAGKAAACKRSVEDYYRGKRQTAEIAMGVLGIGAAITIAIIAAPAVGGEAALIGGTALTRGELMALIGLAVSVAEFIGMVAVMMYEEEEAAALAYCDAMENWCNSPLHKSMPWDRPVPPCSYDWWTGGRYTGPRRGTGPKTFIGGRVAAEGS
jgi:RHS repeat-associated protein